MVTNGVYAYGGCLYHPPFPLSPITFLSNRVCVGSGVSLQSVNGPEFTVIQGYQLPGTNFGGDAPPYAVRCAALNSNSLLAGFTLTKGAAGTQTTNLGAPNGFDQNGGGVFSISGGVVSNCIISGNIANFQGGGAYGGLGFYAPSNALTVLNCVINGNSSSYLAGGGASECILDNCLLIGNSIAVTNSRGGGGGAQGAILNNCTVIGNVAGTNGGGVFGGTLNNCLVYYNVAPGNSNYCGGSFNYCCTAPMPTNGAGNIASDPQLANLGQLASGSLCIGAGNAAYASGVDLNGVPWANPPSIGCYEYYPANATGPLSVAIYAPTNILITNLIASFTAQIGGLVTASRWDFGDGTVVTNQPLAAHSWTALGDYPVQLSAYNQSYPNGVSATVTVHVVESMVHYVALANITPLAPYTSWDTAATNIQDAMDAVFAPQTMVLVSNGVYQTGGRGNARVRVSKPVTIQSLNGPGVTVIEGNTNSASAVSCALVTTNGVVLSGFTLTNGSGLFAGGAFCYSTQSVVTNCIIIGNSGQEGGGAYGGTLNNCVLSNNFSPFYGGGANASALNNCLLTGNSASSVHGEGGAAYGSTLRNCTVTGNSAQNGGGVYNCNLYNSIVFYNSAANGSNYYGGSLSYCCAAPLPAGTGNIASDPQLSDGLHLGSNSPCINAGCNSYVATTTDLDGNPRIAGGTVDIGAYEFQWPASVISYAWLDQYGLPTDGSVDRLDTDGSGMTTWQKWIAGLDPTNPQSVLMLLAPAATNNPSGVTVTWESVSGITYFLESATSMGDQVTFSCLASNITGQTGTTSHTDATATNGGSYYYRVGVQH